MYLAVPYSFLKLVSAVVAGQEKTPIQAEDDDDEVPYVTDDVKKER